MKNLLVILLPVVMAVMAVSCSSGDGWKLVWEENFESGVIDTTVWSKTERGGADWAKTQSKDKRCFAFRDGNLVLRGIVNDNLQADSSAYLCGGLVTKGKKEFAPGHKREKGVCPGTHRGEGEIASRARRMACDMVVALQWQKVAQRWRNRHNGTIEL